MYKAQFETSIQGQKCVEQKKEKNEYVMVTGRVGATKTPILSCTVYVYVPTYKHIINTLSTGCRLNFILLLLFGKEFNEMQIKEIYNEMDRFQKVQTGVNING